MRRLLLFLLLTVTILLQPTHTLAVGPPPDDTPGNAVDPENLLYGTWYCIDYGFHGCTEYYWSFAKDGRFAYYIAGLEPPHGGGEIDGSVSEYYAQGKFRENGIKIECYEIKADSYFAWGNERKYFPDREPSHIAGMLLGTPLQEPENADNFSLGFEFGSNMVLRLKMDQGNPLEMYDMDFQYVETAVADDQEYIESFIEWARGLTHVVYLSEEKVNELKVGATCIFRESEKQSIPFRWRYSISDESLISVANDHVKDTSGLFVKPGGDSAYRRIEFTALAPGECVITFLYGSDLEEEWDDNYDVKQVCHIEINE